MIDQRARVRHADNKEVLSLDSIAAICAGAVPLEYNVPTPAAGICLVASPTGEELRVVVHAFAYGPSGTEMIQIEVRTADGRVCPISGWGETDGAAVYSPATLARPITLRSGESLWATDYAAGATLLIGGAGYKDVRP